MGKDSDCRLKGADPFWMHEVSQLIGGASKFAFPQEDVLTAVVLC